jgi:uncharacterized protein YkwD
MRWTPVLLVVLVVSLAAATTAPAGPALALEHQASLAQDVIDELNRVRTARGLPRMRSQAGLRVAANEHSQSMLTAGFFAHESPDGTPFHNRIRKHYPSRGWQTWSVGETLLSSGGALDARAIVAAWLASPGHRDVILTARWRKVGIGAFVHPHAPGPFGGAQALAVTADFGLREK